jgi:hypothetical protein
VDSWEAVEVEWGFPKRLLIISRENSSMRDFGYNVVPAWSR